MRSQPPESVCVRVTVHGRVQGVTFRDATRHEAARLGVAGWVRNQSDGSVEAEFEGEARAVAEIVAWCHHGPSWARVERVETSQGEAAGTTGFQIR